MQKDYFVYWIKTKEHVDIKTEGYVGISRDPRRRFGEHAKGDKIIGRAIKKHGIREYVIIYQNVSIDEAKRIENHLRPCSNIGWNVAMGGQIPPIKTGSRKNHSERMKGVNNPFYGKTHDVQTKQLLSEMKKGKNHPFYDKKRPEHSKKMKSKRGEKYPKFRGHFITPHGEFDSYKTACDETGITISSLYQYCIINNEKVVSPQSYGQSKILKELFTKEQAVGKTYKCLGFGFSHE
jgi:group I intron endonuclease